MTPRSQSLEPALGIEHLPNFQDTAYKAFSVTNRDTIIETSDGHRLPGVPPPEATKLNAIKNADSLASSSLPPISVNGQTNIEVGPAFTDPLFLPLPAYGPGTPLRRLQCLAFRVTSGMLSLCFLGVVVISALAESTPGFVLRQWKRLRGGNPDLGRPFWETERVRQEAREIENDEDRLLCDIGYYARRVGLDSEKYTVETEDGFLLGLHHVFDPQDPPYYPLPQILEKELRTRLPRKTQKRPNIRSGRRRYPILLIHGLLQSAGAFCVNDSGSLAFYLVRCGYDVFLGNNRCGFNPQHTVLHYSDPRMWAWNIRQMGILDLPAFISPILALTQHPKLALIAHSQGTTQTFVALAKQQRPDLGEKISIFCALAPAVYAGPLTNKFYFKLMKLIPPSAFRIVFGIHAFIPFMMTMHRIVPARWYGRYGRLGYRVFWFLFGWSDTRWDRGLRSRFLRFAPVFVSAEAMRWWLGRKCFARHRCILSTRSGDEGSSRGKGNSDGRGAWVAEGDDEKDTSGARSWFDKRFPPLAMWIAGSDELVNGRRLLRRFELGQEPEVKVVWSKIIEEYEHLDVVWAIDALDQVFREVADVVEQFVGD